MAKDTIWCQHNVVSSQLTVKTLHNQLEDYNTQSIYSRSCNVHVCSTSVHCDATPYNACRTCWCSACMHCGCKELWSPQGEAIVLCTCSKSWADTMTDLGTPAFAYAKDVTRVVGTPGLQARSSFVSSWHRPARLGWHATCICYVRYKIAGAPDDMQKGKTALHQEINPIRFPTSQVPSVLGKLRK